MSWRTERRGTVEKGMPSHQDRRDPLPADYQFPTHGVDCDCPPCRDRVAKVGEPEIVWPLEPTAETPWGV